ncbi:MAG: hypothetical protein ABI824_06960 [Acidobacteriota bacterium]
MPKPIRGKHAELVRLLTERRPAVLGEAEWEELRQALTPISTGYLRRLLRAEAETLGIGLSSLVEGVRQESYETLERSLNGLFEEYEPADRARRTAIRKIVIEAKEHAKLAGRKRELHVEKREMVLWMVTWLENPVVFAQWVQLRRQMLGSENHAD